MNAWFYRDRDGLSHATIVAIDIVGLVLLVALFLWLRWSLKEVTRPQRVELGYTRMLEDEANEAWALYREDAYDHALLIAFHNGDLIDAMKERAHETGDAFRGFTTAVRRSTVVQLDPHSRRV